MVEIINPDVISEIQDVCSIQSGYDILPKNLSNQIVPVININPKTSRYATIIGDYYSAATGSVTVLAAKSRIRYVITGAMLCATYDVACDCAGTQLVITLNGAVKNLIGLNRQPLTAGNDRLFIDCSNHPIICDGNTALTLQKSYALGSANFRAIVYGWEEQIR
jgi:hypothetical protein